MLSGLPSQAGSGLGALQICCAGGQQRGQGDQATELEPAGQPAARRSCLIRQGFIDDLGMYRIQVEERRVEQIAPAGQRLDDVASLLIAKNLPKHIDLLIEAALADDAVCPAIGEQLLATDHFARSLDQAFEHATPGKAQLDALLAAAVAQLIVPRLKEQITVTLAGAQADDIAG